MRQRFMIIAAVAFAAAWSFGRADDALPAAVAAFVDAETVGIVRIDFDRIDVDAFFKRIAPLYAEAKMVAEQRKYVADVVKQARDAGIDSAYCIVYASFEPDPSTAIVVPLGAKTNGDAAMTVLNKLGNMKVEKVGNALVAGKPAVVQRVKALKPAPRPDLAAALASAKETAVHAVFALTPDLRRVVEETVPELPAAIGGGSVKSFTQGIKWASASLTTAPKCELQFVVQASDTATAKKLDDASRAFLKSVVKELHDASDQQVILASLAGVWSPTVENDRLVARIDESRLDKNMPTLAGRVRAAAGRTQAMNNLKQIALAMHQYMDVYGTFPTDIVDKSGKPLLSWRVAILPFLDQNNLYKQFRLDEPWDGEHNKQLVEKMPTVYRSPQQKSAAGTTTYLGPSGEGFIFSPKANGKGVKLSQILDGTSNTILTVDVNDEHAVPWTKPADWVPAETDPLKDLIGHYSDGFAAGFADGSVRIIKKTIDAKSLRALLTIAGGEDVKIP